MSNVLHRGSLRALAGASATVAALVPSAAHASDVDTQDPITIQGTCGNVFTPSISGGKARWEIFCQNDRVWVVGWVEDTWSWDGQCIQVQFDFSDHTRYKHACDGKRVHFDGREDPNFKGPGSHVFGYLSK